MKKITRTLLILEKDTIALKKMQEMLTASGYKIFAASEILQLSNLTDNNVMELALINVEFFSSISSSEILGKFLQRRNLPVVFIYPADNPGEIEKTRDIASYGYLMKNAAEIVLLSAITNAINLHSLHIKTSSQLDEIEASNEELQATMEELEAINDELINTQKNLRESEGKYRRLHESVMDAVIIIDNKGIIIEVNKAFQDLTGFSEEELLKMRYYDITPGKWKALENNIYKQQLLTFGYTEIYEKEFILKTGKTIPVEMRAYIYKDEDGNKAGVWAIVRDISERRKAAEARDRSEKIITSLFNATPIGINLLVDRIIQKTNNATCSITGYAENEIVGQPIRMMYPNEEEYINNGHDLYGQMNAEGLGIKVIHVRKKDGTIIDVLASIAPVDKDNPAAGVCATIMDITEQKMAVEALDRSEKILKSMLDSTPIGVALLLDRKFQMVNAAQCRITGYNEHELLGQTTRMLYPDEKEFIEAGEYLNEQIKSEGLGSTEVHILRKDGSVIDAFVTEIPIDAEDPSAGYCATVMDITERKKAEQTLIKSENLLRNFLEEVMEGIAILDEHGTVTFWNNVCSVMTGISSHEAMGKYWWDLVLRLEPEEKKTEKYLHKLESLFRKITESDFKKHFKPAEVSIKRLDGQEVLLERRIFPVKTMAGIQYAITILDITEKKYAELLKENALKELEKSETRFRSIIQGSSDMIFILDRNGSLTYESPSVSLISGYPPGYFIGKSPFTHIHPDDYKAVYGKINQIEQGIYSGTPAEFRSRKSDGGWIFLELLGNNQYDNPSINGIVLTVRDISERKCSEIALRNSENLFKTLLNTTPAGVALLKDRILKKVNNALCTITGYNEDELIGKSTRILYFNDEEFNYVGKKLYDFKKENIAEMLEARLRKKDGTPIDVLLSQSPFNIEDINAGVCTTVLDITERNRVVNALRESENELKSLLDSAPIGIGMIRNRKFIKVNRALCKMTGYSENELLNKLTRIIYPSDEIYEKIGIELYECMIKNGVGTMETFLLTKNGLIREIQLSLNPFDENDLSMGQCATALDITDRKRLEKKIRESEEKYRSIYENMPIGFVRTDLEGAILDINPAAIQLFGYNPDDEAIKIFKGNVVDFHLSQNDMKNTVQDLLKTAVAHTYVYKMKKKNGSLFTASLILKLIRLENGEPAFIEGMIEDITEREKMQDILIQSEKMMTVAGLAAGMAHEINNPLGIIMQNAENAMLRLLDKLPGNIKAAEEAGITLEQLAAYIAQRRIDNYLEAIREAGRRAARIVASMLQFSRMTESRITYMNINMLIDRALELASNDFDLRKKYDFKKIIITKKFGEIPDIPCVETQIEQVLLNIFKNSAQAMSNMLKEKNHIPEIIISTRKEDFTVRIEIQDNGPGMDETVRKRIFEPFFTTKQTGSGTGLGLSVSYYIIVNGHKGMIWVDSSRGDGTKIVITLPLSNKDN